MLQLPTPRSATKACASSCRYRKATPSLPETESPSVRTRIVPGGSAFAGGSVRESTEYGVGHWPATDATGGGTGRELGRARVHATTTSAARAKDAGTTTTGLPKGRPRVRIGCSSQRYDTTEMASVAPRRRARSKSGVAMI